MNVATATAASPAERRFWLAEMAAPGAPANIAFGRFRIDGPADPDRLLAALHAVRERHDALRTAFRLVGADLVRDVRDDLPPLVLMSLSPDAGPDDAEAALCAHPMDLASADTIRLARTPDTLCFAVHHIAFDGLSEAVFVADLAAAYDGTRLRHRPRSPDVPPDAGEAAELASYWHRQLSGARDLPGLPISQRDLAKTSLVELPLTCDPAELGHVRATAAARSVSPFAVLLHAFGTALARCAGASDFCIGTAVAHRGQDQLDEIGALLNMVPIRLASSVDELWPAVLDAMANAALPFDDIVRACAPGRGVRMPLYQALFLLQNWPRPVHRAAGVRIQARPTPPRGPQAEVLMELHDLGGASLTGVLQAPLGGTWAARLAEVADDFHHQLLAPDHEGKKP